MNAQVRTPRLWCTLAVTVLMLANFVLILAQLSNWKLFGPVYAFEDGGTVAEWVAAVGVVGALLATLVAVSIQSKQSEEAISAALRQLALAAEEAKEREQESRAAQAALVSGWIVPIQPGHQSERVRLALEEIADRWGLLRSRHLTELYELGIRERGDDRPLAPAEYDELNAAHRARIEFSYRAWSRVCEAYGESSPREIAVAALRISNQSAAPVFEMASTIADGLHDYIATATVVPPSRDTLDYELWGTHGEPLLVQEATSAQLARGAQLSLRFRDTSGVSWTRSSSGELSESDPWLSEVE